MKTEIQTEHVHRTWFDKLLLWRRAYKAYPKRYYAARKTQRARAPWLGCRASHSFSLVPLSPLGNGAFA